MDNRTREVSNDIKASAWLKYSMALSASSIFSQKPG